MPLLSLQRLQEGHDHQVRGHHDDGEEGGEDYGCRHLRTHNRYEHQESSSIDDSVLSSKADPAARSASTESDTVNPLPRDTSDNRLARDFSEGQYSFEAGESGRGLSREFSESRLSRYCSCYYSLVLITLDLCSGTFQRIGYHSISQSNGS